MRTTRWLAALVCGLALGACGDSEGPNSDTKQAPRDQASVKADSPTQTALSCRGACGELVWDAGGYCGCDDLCDDFGDCCNDKRAVCDGEPACDDPRTKPEYIPSTDGKECRVDKVYCVTSDHNACPLFSPLPPDYCADGTVETEPGYVPSADGMECSIPRVHCLTDDDAACEQP